MNLTLQCTLPRDAYCPLCALPLVSNAWSVCSQVAYCLTCSRHVDLPMQARVAHIAQSSSANDVMVYRNEIYFWCPREKRLPSTSLHLDVVRYPREYDPRTPMLPGPNQCPPPAQLPKT